MIPSTKLSHPSNHPHSKNKMQAAAPRPPPDLQVHRFEHLPSAPFFQSHIESKNVPAVFVGCVKDWKAFSLWDPANGGLDYLQKRAGSCVVEAMLSKSAPVFYGDLRSHERVPLTFSSFIDHCKQQMEGKVASPTPESEDSVGFSPQEIYLAQVSIMNAEDSGRAQLGALDEDIEKPTFLGGTELASINLWMNNARARSSTHYDPHHNILCIVAGCKQVVLWPPSASPLLYPMPLYGEASNHSSIALDNPDFSLYPRAECSMDYSLKVTLNAGDALFIPEGWFHQVDSDDLTIAVNFWWQSNMMCSMLEHMDAYYLRRIIRSHTATDAITILWVFLGNFGHQTNTANSRLIDKELDLLCHNEPAEKAMKQACKLSDGKMDQFESERQGLHANEQLQHRVNLHANEQLQHRVNLHDLEPHSLHALQKLVSLVHDCISVPDHSQSVQLSPTDHMVVADEEGGNRLVRADLFLLEDDPVAVIFSALDPYTLQKVLLAMVHNFPRTLEALVLHLLSPVGAEVLTQKFEEMDKLLTEEDRNKFYQDFYSAFDDQFAVMNAILNAKELFALKAFKNVLDKYLGVNLDVPKPSLG